MIETRSGQAATGLWGGPAARRSHPPGEGAGAAALEETRPGLAGAGPGWSPGRELSPQVAALAVVSVEAGGWRFAVPAAMVVHQERLSRAEGEALAAAGAYHGLEAPVPAVDLAGLASFLPPADWSPREAAVLVVEAGGRLALVVDRLLAADEVAFEPFLRPSGAVSCICGIGVTPSGERAAVLDPRQLLRRREATGAAPLPEAAPPGSLLIADDCLGTRQGLSRLAAGLGFEPLPARDGVEVLEAVSASGPPALLLLDGELPGINAEELVALLRAQGALRQVPVVLLTSASSDRKPLAGLGASASLLRPFRLETAAAVIRLLAGGEGGDLDGDHPGR